MKQRITLVMLLLSLVARAQQPTQPAASPAPTPPPESFLLSGPMVGYCEMREVMIWVQTNGPATVYLEYTAGAGQPRFRTESYLTNLTNAYAAHIRLDQVRPGMLYTYQLYINGQEVKRPYALSFQTPPLWQWRTDPPEMNFAVGSCAYINDEPYDRPGKPYGGDYRVFEAIHAKKPDFMVWLGDNTYLREADWYSRTGIIHRYTHSRHVEELQPLLGSTAHYAIWDDHDYGPNDSDYTFRDKAETRRAFQLFWSNPSYGLDGQQGITTSFEWGDAQFFMLDDRWFRDPNKKPGTRTILGEEQLQWLLDGLSSSNAKFKFVCVGGQLLNTAAVYENFSNIAPAERERILSHITTNGIKNVVFLTGDRHHSEMSRYEQNGIKVYDFTASPLTAGTGNAANEANALRVAGSYFAVHSFGHVTLSGPRDKRQATFTYVDADGKELWRMTIDAQ
ncbi:MAG: alkaline phosphatase D family protein [Bacteroidia bacterium]|nr:alkaline phosphatase D family protein [Bacteroidia bacterium]